MYEESNNKKEKVNDDNSQKRRSKYTYEPVNKQLNYITVHFK